VQHLPGFIAVGYESSSSSQSKKGLSCKKYLSTKERTVVMLEKMLIRNSQD